MCDYKTIHSNTHGYVVRCKGCRHIHVGFGSNILAFTTEQFLSFAKCVERHYMRCDVHTCKNAKSIQIATQSSAVTLVYTPLELEHLNELLHQSGEILGRERLFQFNHN